MEKILILVEGQTEETFVRNVLSPHLLGRGKHIISTLVVTKRVKSGPNFKGGVSSYNQVKRDLVRLLRDTSAKKITTMLDYYALPSDFPGWTNAPPLPPGARAQHLERAFATDIGDGRFLPYLSQHEFEALLFVDPPSASWVYGDNANVVEKLVAVRTAFGGQPEMINDGPTTAPSKRVEAAFPAYQKPLHGPLACEAAGLATLRASCPHFDRWISALES